MIRDNHMSKIIINNYERKPASQVIRTIGEPRICRALRARGISDSRADGKNARSQQNYAPINQLGEPLLSRLGKPLEHLIESANQSGGNC